MKTNKIFMMSLLSMALVSFSAMAKAPAKPNVKVAANRPELIDWQGATLGKEVPEWVMAVNDGDNAGVSKALKIDTDKVMVFVLDGRGADLDFVKTWDDNVDARREISTSISQVVATTTEAAMAGMETADGSLKEKMYKDATQMASAIELNGLMKGASYWIKTRTLPIGISAKKAKDSDYIIEYTYYVVFTIDRKIYDKQVSAAMNHVEENTSEESYLKRVLAEKLSQTILPGNNLGSEYHQ